MYSPTLAPTIIFSSCKIYTDVFSFSKFQLFWIRYILRFLSMSFSNDLIKAYWNIKTSKNSWQFLSLITTSAIKTQCHVLACLRNLFLYPATRLFFSVFLLCLSTRKSTFYIIPSLSISQPSLFYSVLLS